MNYEEAIDFIHSSYKFGSKLGLDNIRELLKRLGNPQSKLDIIHIAGTNGKGSTASFVNQILIEAGYKVGLFTSPYLEYFNERIRVDNILIDEDDLIRGVLKIKNAIDKMVEDGHNHPTEFEIVTALGFLHFLDKKVDIVVLEVGLGGRFDATNVIEESMASVITSISKDHTHILGNTLEEIAFEKSGIIKENGHVYVYPQKIQAEKVIENISAKRGAVFKTYDISQVKNIKFTEKGSVFDIEIEELIYKNLEIKMLGRHQVYNSTLAVMMLDDLNRRGLVNIEEKHYRLGLLNTRWNGRLEIISENPLILIDGAHNEDGARALSEALSEYYKSKKKILCIGVLKDKDLDVILEYVLPHFDEVVVTEPCNPRALGFRELEEKIKERGKSVIAIKELDEAIETTLKKKEGYDLFVFSGSLYLIGEIRKYIGKK
ncbi:MAG: bifunctional folylpolyglutamate synthase/dihydrofolate synthase [Tissierellales bacterium]|jgi:dihydrofolate synthase/folylpolyglutamate synthase|nr:bifunctional folylpolyglutamate synthase/dihydrofolate synthase [Tissierellales bacterium]